METAIKDCVYRIIRKRENSTDCQLFSSILASMYVVRTSSCSCQQSNRSFKKGPLRSPEKGARYKKQYRYCGGNAMMVSFMLLAVLYIDGSNWSQFELSFVGVFFRKVFTYSYNFPTKKLWTKRPVVLWEKEMGSGQQQLDRTVEGRVR